MVESVRTRRAFSALSSSRNRGRSGPVWVVRAAAPDDGRTSTDRAHVAYAIGRAVGGAVVRNRLRRRLRAVMNDVERDGALTPGLYLVGAAPPAVTSSFSDLRAHVSRAVADVTVGAR